MAVRVTNATPEPDGTRREYVLVQMPPGTKTAKKVVAWTFGLSARECRPGAQAW